MRCVKAITYKAGTLIASRRDAISITVDFSLRAAQYIWNPLIESVSFFSRPAPAAQGEKKGYLSIFILAVIPSPEVENRRL